MITKDFIVAINYSYKYGMFDPEKDKKQAYLEFGKFADQKLGKNAPNGLNGVWWDEVKQFVEPGIIDWSFVNNL
jgi:hypothetical protein